MLTLSGLYGKFTSPSNNTILPYTRQRRRCNNIVVVTILLQWPCTYKSINMKATKSSSSYQRQQNLLHLTKDNKIFFILPKATKYSSSYQRQQNLLPYIRDNKIFFLILETTKSSSSYQRQQKILPYIRDNKIFFLILETTKSSSLY